MSGLQETPLSPNEVDQVILNNHTIPPDHVLVHVLISAISSSNNDTRIGDFDTPPSTIVEGHGSAGFITKVGPSVTTLKSGDCVAIELTPPCGAPKYTRYTTNTSQTYYILPVDACTKLEEPLTLYEGALVEPIAIAINLVHEANLSNKRVIIFGANFIGVICCILSKSRGAEVLVVDFDNSRLKLAERFSAKPFNMSGSGTAEETKAEIVKVFPGADVTINASGDDNFVPTATYVLNKGGLYLHAGVKPSEYSFEVVELWNNNITVKGNIGYTTGDFSEAVTFMCDNKASMREFARS